MEALNKLFVLTIVIVCLYVFYRLFGGVIMPALTRRHFQRYKRNFFSRNPHIDEQSYEQRQRDKDEQSPIIDKRRNFHR